MLILKYQTPRCDREGKGTCVWLRMVILAPMDFIMIAPENPFLWTGMKGASAKGRKKSNQMLKRA